MSQQPFAGVIFGSEDGLIHLPLEEVEVRALIVDREYQSLWRILSQG